MKKSRKPLQENYSTEGWMSFSDIMTGLLFIFLLIIMTMMYLNREENTRYRDLQEREAALNEKIKLMAEREHKLEEHIKTVNSQIKEPEEKTHEIMALITSDLKRKGINVSLDKKNNVIHVLDSELKFESGEYSIPGQYDQTVRILTDEISSVLMKNADSGNRIHFIDTIFIEGHTDKVFYNNSRLFGNWGLSTLRAISVWNTMNEYSEKSLEKYRNTDGRPLFSVSGYADMRPNPCSNEGDSKFRTQEACGDAVYPLSENDSNAKNRRIDIRFFPHMEKIEEYKGN